MTDVSTYIQSGNVLFKSGISTNKKIVSTLEKALSESFAYDARVVVVKKEDYLHMVGSAHKSWGKKGRI
jgi:uncharacterized protein (DUF1697 family)